MPRISVAIGRSLSETRNGQMRMICRQASPQALQARTVVSGILGNEIIAVAMVDGVWERCLKKDALLRSQATVGMQSWRKGQEYDEKRNAEMIGKILTEVETKLQYGSRQETWMVHSRAHMRQRTIQQLMCSAAAGTPASYPTADVLDGSKVELMCEDLRMAGFFCPALLDPQVLR